MCGFTDGLAGPQIVSANVLGFESDRKLRGRRPEVENRLQLNLESVQFPREKVICGETVALSCPVELSNHGRAIEGKVERRKAIRRVPPSPLNSGPNAGARIAPRTDMTKRRAGERRMTEFIDLCNQVGRSHVVLDEDAFGECIKRRQHAAELTVAQELYGLVVLEHWIRCKQPVVCRLGLKSLG